MSGNLTFYTPSLDSGNPATYSEATATAYAAGQLGHVFTIKNATLFDPLLQSRTYQIVLLHSGAGTAAAGQLAIWQDRNNFVVTNAGTAASNVIRNTIAGVLVNASAAVSTFVCIQIGGEGPVLIEAAVTPAVGDLLIAGGTTAGRSQVVAAGTAPTHVVLGLVTSLKNAGSIGTDVVRAQLWPPRLY